MQHPTCTNIRIRSVHDAHKIFYAVQQGLLQMVTRRLDADERMQLRTGCVYAWEERGPHTELTGLGIERFTEGRRWSPSRVRDEFLFYYEKYSPSPDCANPHPPRDWDPLVKQTYSVWVETDKGRRKWHLTAYFTQATVDQLGSIDDMRGVRELVVPDGIFKSTRVTKTRGKNEENRSGESSKSSNTSNAGASRYAPFPAPTLPNQPESSGQVLMYQPYPNHDASSAHQQPQIQDDHKVPPTQQYSTTRASNSNPAHHNTFRDLNPYSSNPQPYRSLLPSSHPRPAPDHLRRDLPNYGPRSEQVSRTFTVADVQHPSAPLPQVRLEGERSLSSHPPPGHISAAGTSLSNSHTSVNAMEEYTPNTQSFSALAASEWGSGNVGNSSMYYGDHHGNVPTSTAAQSTSYLPPPDGVAAGAGTQPYQPMQYLSPLHGNLAGGSSAPREPLPSLSTLQEAYSFSYDFSVAMVSQSTVGSSSGSLNSNLSPTSSSNSSQKPRTQAPGSNKAGGPCRDLDLAPLNSLSRLHPYRREPMDDRALRLLGPRSP